MAVSELLAPYVIADRHRRADNGRRARTAMAARRNNSVRTRPAPDEDDWMPQLRGYPIDQTFARYAAR